MLPQMSGYIICFDKTKHMSFMIKDIKVLGKFSRVWDKVSNLMEKGFDSEPIYDD